MDFCIYIEKDCKVFANKIEVGFEFSTSLPVLIECYSAEGRGDVFISASGEILTNTARVLLSQSQAFVRFFVRGFPRLLLQEEHILLGTEHTLSVFEEEYNVVLENSTTFFSISQRGYLSCKGYVFGEGALFFLLFEDVLVLVFFRSDYTQVLKIPCTSYRFEEGSRRLSAVFSPPTSMQIKMGFEATLPGNLEGLQGQLPLEIKVFAEKPKNFCRHTFAVAYFEMLQFGHPLGEYLHEELRGEEKALAEFVGKFCGIVAVEESSAILVFRESKFKYIPRKFLLEVEWRAEPWGERPVVSNIVEVENFAMPPLQDWDIFGEK